MLRRSLALLVLVLAAASGWAAPPSSDQLLSLMLAGAGGDDDFGALGVLALSVTEEETMSDGSTDTGAWQGFVYSRNLDNMRLELPGQIVVVRNQDQAWASVGGQLDERPQTPRMARGTVNQKLFPLLLPFSLTMDGVVLREISASSFEGTPTWRATVVLPAGFMTSPSMGAPWRLEVARDSGRLLAAEVLPPDSMREVAGEGLRYQTIGWKEVDGAKVPSKVLLEGIDFNRNPNGHVRITTISSEVRGAFDPRLFVNPSRLEDIEEGEIPELE